MLKPHVWSALCTANNHHQEPMYIPGGTARRHPVSLLSPLTSWMATKQRPGLRETQRDVCRQIQRGLHPQGCKSLMSPKASTERLLEFLCLVPRLDGEGVSSEYVRWRQWRRKAAGKVPPCQSHGLLLLELFTICSLAPLSWISSMGYTSGSAHQVIKNTHLKITKTSKLEIIQTSSLKTALKQPATATERL